MAEKSSTARAPARCGGASREFGPRRDEENEGLTGAVCGGSLARATGRGLAGKPSFPSFFRGEILTTRDASADGCRRGGDGQSARDGTAEDQAEIVRGHRDRLLEDEAVLEGF